MACWLGAVRLPAASRELRPGPSAAGRQSRAPPPERLSGGSDRLRPGSNAGTSSTAASGRHQPRVPHRGVPRGSGCALSRRPCNIHVQPGIGVEHNVSRADFYEPQTHSLLEPERGRPRRADGSRVQGLGLGLGLYLGSGMRGEGDPWGYRPINKVPLEAGSRRVRFKSSPEYYLGKCTSRPPQST